MKSTVTAVMVLVVAALSVAQQRNPTKQAADEHIRLRASVQAVVHLRDFSGEVTPVDFDPRFALSVRIESAVPAVPNFRSGSVVTFAIHSPSLLFSGDPVKGRTYGFSLVRRVENGKVRFRDLRVQ